MSKTKTSLIQAGLFIFYCVITYNLALPNFWLSAIIALLLVSTFTNSNKIQKLNELFSGGLVDTFKVNDDMHDKHTQAIEDLNNRIIELEIKLGELDNKVFDLENPH